MTKASERIQSANLAMTWSAELDIPFPTDDVIADAAWEALVIHVDEHAEYR